MKGSCCSRQNTARLKRACRARHETYDGARAIVETHGDGHGIELAYARDMIRPS
jgi:membrane-bound lytic murein transglycosylase